MPLTLKKSPDDFVVEERLRVKPGRDVPHVVYRATKRMLTTVELQERVAAALKVQPRDVVFTAMKDKRAVTSQHFSLQAAQGPPRIAGDGWEARYVGRLERPLSPGDLEGNLFTITLHGLDERAADALLDRLEALERHGLPNYFDDQRFGSHTPGTPWFGKAVLLGDAWGALRCYLAEPAPGDTEETRQFKRYAREHWGDWPVLFERAPRSNHRSVLTYLKDHPEEHRKALNLITPRLLPLLLAAYQSHLWNRIASRIIERRITAMGAPLAKVIVAGEPLAAYAAIGATGGRPSFLSPSSEAKGPSALSLSRPRERAPGEGSTQSVRPEPVEGRTAPRGLATFLRETRSLSLALPSHRATYPGGDVADAAQAVLAAEGLTLEALKARILERAYLPKGERPLLVFPREASMQLHAQGTGGRYAVALSFFLPPGAYATLVMKGLG
ncbi:MAG: tRNA pseudouridine(13) synthase TruD [Chloroflexi bacterium]|nr:tRNA pseudouridine(13) synthase TruD [Chloroflexota bacterium]